ncbi:MAG: O-antigen ligase family protein [Elusimicrobia bacterium]|nr:O-antigen ligase family protein [Elusimicrobiota bacterium]
MPIILVLVALVAAGWLGFMASSVSPYFLFTVCSAFLVSLFAFSSPKLSLGLLLFSMLFSPEIGFGALTGSRGVVVRYDDILLVIIFLAWLAKGAVLKGKAFVTDTPVQTPIILYTSLCVLSTVFGILRGNIRYEVAVFYILKYVEYFLLYFLTVNVLESREDIRKYLNYAFFISLAVTVYAYFYYFTAGAGARASAPFEAAFGKPGESEPASLGGYYLIVMGVLFGLLTSGPVLGWPLAALAFIFPAFLLTFSRASYIGFVVMLGAVILKTERRRLLLISILLLGSAALYGMKEFTGKVRERVEMTYSGQYAVYEVGFLGVTFKLEESAYSRYAAIRDVFQKWLPKHPVLGSGVTGVGLGDTQYALLLGEVGLVGFFAFFWMVYRIYSAANAVFRAYQEPWIKAASLGLMVSLLGLLAQAVGVNTFIIVRIMEPFWFLTAVIMRLYILRGAPADGPAQSRA